jgi:hypothetical protein
MKDKRTAEGGDILNFENFVTRPMQEQGMVVCHEAASSTRWLLGGVAHLALKVSGGTARNAGMQVDHVRICFHPKGCFFCVRYK